MRAQELKRGVDTSGHVRQTHYPTVGAGSLQPPTIVIRSDHILGLRLIGTSPEKAGVLSFVIDGHDPEEVGSALNGEGIAVRAGHHCAQPILRRFGVEKTLRASLALYNTCADIDGLVTALTKIVGRRPLQLAVPTRSKSSFFDPPSDPLV